ncbi:MAG TPA: ABC transporter substrate-binding protein [Gammaproteobacteria bacterium]|jgi:putative hydroxymethylpyrimidine transport system substrate-binding protein|nr:ABC transporter substrate-binding protein [Gammaproteobacteria bacterium]
MKKILSFLLMLALCPHIAVAAPRTLVVMLDAPMNPNHAPLIVAQQEGFFKKEGIDVKFVEPHSPKEAINATVTQQVDIGITEQPELLTQVDHHQPIIRIGTLIDKPLDCLVVLSDSHIDSLADLQNKRIGTLQKNLLDTLMLQSFLTQQGLKNHVSIVNLHQKLMQALLSHRVDAVSGLKRNVEVPELDAAHHALNVFLPEEHGIPSYDALIFITHLNKLHDPRLPRFLAALEEAVRYLDEHPRQAWEKFAKTHPNANTPVNRDTWFSTLTYFSENPANFDSAAWENFAAFLKQNNIIRKVQPVSQYAITLG